VVVITIKLRLGKPRRIKIYFYQGRCAELASPIFEKLVE
jgi:hypothetical protein